MQLSTIVPLFLLASRASTLAADNASGDPKGGSCIIRHASSEELLHTFDDTKRMATDPFGARLQCEANNRPEMGSPWCPIAYCYGDLIEDNPCSFGCTDSCSDPNAWAYRKFLNALLSAD